MIQIRKNAVEQTSKKTIRLIHRGQLLNNDLYTLSDYGIQQQNIFIHCALSDPIIPTNIIHDIEITDKNDVNAMISPCNDEKRDGGGTLMVNPYSLFLGLIN